MSQFDALVGDGEGRGRQPGIDAFSVPPRFADATFASYRPDPRFPSQEAARTRVAEALRALQRHEAGSRRWFGLRRRASGRDWQGLYLDGGFGVGKTHLLASAWHAVPDVSRAYLSFQELTYVVGALGMAGALDLFGSADLICLDEFELDDPGNTMLATSFVRGTLERGAHIIATSNTLPSDLGRGRFNADEFKREIGQLAAAFESIGIDGEDYRHRRYAGGGPPERLLPAGGRPPVALPPIDWSALLAGLAAVHPIRYGRIVASLDGLWVRDVESIPEQDTALRVVYFMDKLYDYRVPLALSGDVSLDSLFPSTYGYGSFERNFRRCRSRLYEMLTEPIDVMAIRPAAADD